MKQTFFISQKINSGFFDVMKKMKSITHIFAGHNHINNLSVDWQGIRLSYGIKNGTNNYYDKNMQGGILLTLSGNDTINLNIKHILKKEN